MKAASVVLTFAGISLIAGPLTIGPDYQRPETATPSSFKAMGTWKIAQPADHLPKGNWWEIFGDPILNALQAKAHQSNQELQAAFAVVNQSRAAARVARAEFFPAIDANPSFRRDRFSPTQEPSFGAITANTFRMPLDLSYEIDLWGRVRRSFEGARAEAEASVAAFHNVMLTLQADLAQNYFALRALDAEIAVLERSVTLRNEQVGIMTSRFDIGLGTELDVARARTELATIEADLASVKRRRVQLENAIAILVGESPSAFAVAKYENPGAAWNPVPPAIPPDLPSNLLERRPDIAEAERQLAADNARIGVAKAGFFPALRLTGSAGYMSADVDSLFNWESRFWSIGPSISLPIFAGGRNVANLRRSRARFEESVARYRQRVLVAFGEVENALAGIQLLAEEAAAQQRALTTARRARELAMESFTTGLTSFLDVIDADRAALQTDRANALVAGARYVATIQLIKALGGGWATEPHNL